MKDLSPSATKNSTFIVHPASMRILLWDIDGTLMRSKAQGGYKKYFAATMTELFGSAGKLEEIIPSGMTDTQIMFEALKSAGISPERIFERKTELLEVFRRKMLEVLDAGGEPYERLAGAEEILTETAQKPYFVNALLTGNLSVAAEIKLSNVGLWHFFQNAPNAFGEISHQRTDLAIEAGKLFNERYNFEFSPQQFIVIGDTPNDILCAKHFGAKSVAVLTGRNQTREKLSAYEPNAVLEDLKDTKKVRYLLETV